MRIVLRARRSALPAPFKLPFTSTASALSMAISVPFPIANPMSASLSAGASLIPSPTIITARRARFGSPAFSRISLCTDLSLSSGSTSAYTQLLEIPASSAMYSAQERLSPVSMTTFPHSAFSSLTASLLPSFRVSASAKSASVFLLSAKNSTVFPSFESFPNVSSSNVTPICRMSLSLPRK